MNDGLGENGMVSIRLVFGVIRKLPILSTKIYNQKVRMEVLVTAQAEIMQLN